MMRSLFTAVSGLKNHQTRMDVIGNNISNVNTTGFKSGRVTFADTLSQTLSGASAPNGNIGGVNAKQVGLGMSASSIDTNFSHGSASSTGINTDLAIGTDAGLFIVKNGDQTYYTRNGDFTLDNDGNLVMNGSGLHVQGWNGVDGVVSANGTPQNIKIDMGSTMQPQATTQINYGGNLTADDTQQEIKSMKLTFKDGTVANVPAGDTTKYQLGKTFDVPGITPATSKELSSITMTLGDKNIVSSGIAGQPYTLGNSTFPSRSSMATIYDSLGAPHAIPISFQRADASSNKWNVAIPAGTYDGAEIASDATGTLTFNGTTGKLTDGGTLTVDLHVPYPNGAQQSQQVSLDFNALTQYSGESNPNVSKSDGYPAGFYKDMSIGQDGVVTITYTNGQKQQGGQLAIATFNNPSGLEKEGGSLYSASNNSGLAKVGTFAAQGVSVTPGALEMSNVDISNEFSDMIVTQRGFQANSKIITVSDDMLETLINMKR